jgi:hypothetical protein
MACIVANSRALKPLIVKDIVEEKLEIVELLLKSDW